MSKSKEEKDALSLLLDRRAISSQVAIEAAYQLGLKDAPSDAEKQHLAQMAGLQNMAARAR